MRQTAALVAVMLLVVVDVVLAVLAWNHVNADAGSGDQIAAPASATTSGADPTSATSTETSATTGSETDPAPAYAAAVVEGELLARAPVRSCTEPEQEGTATTSVEVSEDGGASFAGFDTPLTSVTEVAAPSASELVAVGTDEQCEVAAVASSDGGQSWDSLAVEDAGWSVVGEGLLVSPGGELADIGCMPADVSGVSTDDAVVLCEDGVVLRTDNAGSFWGAQTTLPFASEVAFVSATEGYALIERGGCPALVRATADGGENWEDVQCVSAQGSVGLAADGDELVLLGADAAYRSADGGENWQVQQ